MSEATIIQLVEEFSGPAPEDPQVFVRSMSTPAGAPWDQARAAALEARLSAPAPLGELAYQVRRIEPWRLSQPARFAAFYVRASAVRDQLTRIVEVDGRPIDVRFLSVSEQARRARRFLVILLIAAVSGIISIAAIASAVSSRAVSATELDAAERLAAARVKQADALRRLETQTRALDQLEMRHLKIGDFLSDLDWASSAKAPDAHIEALHWEHGAMAVEVRGSAAPFANDGRTIRKSERAIRPGVWLWGVAPGTISASGSGGPDERGRVSP